ncbi:MAG TPA: hypothetical protein DCS28_01990 [Candidatus Moranbacteria bacterium]|nr:hypothetical protein [Candidatus Moranbacteria bacterium]HAT74788.1 hypothetical protein [Candidatus Moranbacteria bacterium]
MKKQRHFSFSEKSIIAAILLFSCIIAYFIPINIVWYKISSAITIFVFIFAVMLFVENITQNETFSLF